SPCFSCLHKNRNLMPDVEYSAIRFGFAFEAITSTVSWNLSMKMWPLANGSYDAGYAPESCAPALVCCSPFPPRFLLGSTAVSVDCSGTTNACRFRLRPIGYRHFGFSGDAPDSFTRSLNSRGACC